MTTPEPSTQLSASDLRLWRRIVIVLLICYWSLICYGTHRPPPPVSQPQLVNDKLLHYVAYSGLTLLWFVLLKQHCPRWSTLMRSLCVVVIVLGYGAADELTQPYFHRMADWADWFADLTGCLSTLLLCLILEPKLTPKLIKLWNES